MMLRTLETAAAQSAYTQAARIMERLPEHNYPENCQPEYPDKETLQETIHDILSDHRNDTPTHPSHIDVLQKRLKRVAEGELETPVIIAGRCAEPVGDETTVERLAHEAILTRATVLGAYGLQDALYIGRGRGQNAKPRSAEHETLPDGRTVPSYMGDAVNACGTGNRAPDPRRMVAAVRQALRLEELLTKSLGEHAPSAHEALLLPYEHSLVRLTSGGYREYLLSADMPWIGKRTNDPDGPHVQLLRTVDNPVGIKIGADSTPEHIAALSEKLNPKQLAGKLTFMLRMGSQDEARLSEVVDAIRTHAPKSLVIYDIHGDMDTNEHGEKIRCVPDIIEGIRRTAAACRAGGLVLHGLHLETIGDDSRLECTDEPGQRPTHPGGVDPQLNLRQLRHVLIETKDDLL